MQIEMPTNSIQKLQKLKQKTEASSYAEVAKNAYHLYDKLIEVVEAGNKLLIQDKDGKIKNLELFI